ncbi:MAG: hypothetical protein RID53_20025 [Coleofasciculus sp. B1-GNL1-01]|uniref:hypothetical protein n=1 Tax=Coleofasciculus sp. B1-GNL1-01 TaxID=3068484 RepID=UPI0032F6BBC9
MKGLTKTSFAKLCEHDDPSAGKLLQLGCWLGLGYVLLDTFNLESAKQFKFITPPGLMSRSVLQVGHTSVCLILLKADRPSILTATE